MSFGEIVLLIGTLLVMFVGLIGCLLPVMPGPPVIFAGMFIYAAFTGFEVIGSKFLIIFGVLTALTLLLDNLAGVYGAKRFGATRWGMIGAFIGTIIGMIVGSVVGIIVGPFVFAVLFEFIAGKRSRQAFSAGFGTFVGFVGGTLMKIAVGVAMVGTFLYRVFWPSG